MATQAFNSRKTLVGDVVKYELPEKAYTRELRSVTVTATTAVGTVLAGAAAVTVATTANADGIVVDERVYEKRLVPGTYSLAVLVRGPAIVGDLKLTYGADVDTTAEKNAVVAVLKAKNILVGNQL